MIIAVDFDGTIARSDFPVIRGEMPYAAESLRKLKEQGHYILIWTCRTGTHLLDAVNWLLEHEIPFDRVNDHNPANLARYGDGGNKVYAHCYIDDKNLFGFPGWKECLSEVERMEEAYQSSIDLNK